MSEYQNFQWATVGRTLTPAQRREVNDLSSHINVSNSSAEVEYHYGDFKHDPIKVLEKFFDVFSYEANWGSQCIAFRFDEDAVDVEELDAYLYGEQIQTHRANGSIVFTVEFCDENYVDHYFDSYDDGQDLRFMGLYTEILDRDYRTLFLLWLKASDHYGEEEGSEVPVPDGMSQLDEKHRELIEFIGIDQDLLEAARAIHSRKLTPLSSEEKLKTVLAKLPPERAQYYLERLFEGPGTSARAELLRELRQMQKPLRKRENPPTVGFGRLKKIAEEIKSERRRLEEEQARRQREVYLKQLSDEENSLWAEVVGLIENKNTKSYEEAVLLLRGLEDLWKERGNRDYFVEQVRKIVDRFPRLVGMRGRIEGAGYLTEK